MRRRLTQTGWRLYHAYVRTFAPLTLGVRVAVLDPGRGVLLVRHTYRPGWSFPGGGVERRESLLAAAARELVEEANVRLTAPPTLFSVYSNTGFSASDHVVMFQATAFHQEPFTPNAEIAEARFFPLTELPADATEGTRRRLAELTGAAAISPDW